MCRVNAAPSSSRNSYVLNKGPCILPVHGALPILWLVLPGNFLKMHHLGLYASPSESESASSQEPPGEPDPRERARGARLCTAFGVVCPDGGTRGRD